MFTIVQNYKKMFTSFVINEFNSPEWWNSALIEDKNNNGATTDELIKEFEKDWFTSDELTKIKENFEKEKDALTDEVKNGLQSLITFIEKESFIIDKWAIEKEKKKEFKDLPEIKKVEAKKVETKKVEVKQVESKQLKKAINFNNTEFTSEWVNLIQKKLGTTETGMFNNTDIAAIKKLKNGSDGKIGLGVLKDLYLVKVEMAEDKSKTNLPNNWLTKDMFKPNQLEKGNSKYIVFNKLEKTKTQETKDKLDTKEKTEQIKIKVVSFTKEEAIKVLTKLATEWGEQKLTTYSYELDGETITKDINLYSSDGKLKVELDWTGTLLDLFDDVDTAIDSINEIENWINKIVKEHEDKVNQELKKDFDKKVIKKIKEAKEEANSFPRKLGEYTDFDGETQKIVLKDVSHPWNNGEKDTPEFLVELDDSGKFRDPDVSFDHVPTKTEISEAMTKLLKEYNKEKAEKEMESTWTEAITIPSWDYKWNYDIEFQIDWGELKLDSKFNQPGTDKSEKVTADNLEEIKNKLIAEYIEQVKKQKKVEEYDDLDEDWM